MTAHLEHANRRISSHLTTDGMDSFKAGSLIQTISQPKPFFVYLVLFSTVLIYLLHRHRSRPTTPRSRSPDPEKKPLAAPVRAPGTWTPVPFTRPSAPAYPEWSIETTKPLPYRPFRHGPKYNITLGLRTMDWDEWIELDNEYPRYHADKARRIAERGDKCCRTDADPRVFDGAVELLEELASYLPQRYPSLFSATDNGIRNLFSGEVFDVRKEVLTVNGRREDPMTLAARLVQDDLAIMFERSDGGYYLSAGAILLAGFWRLEDKFGMALSEIHTTYVNRLGTSIQGCVLTSIVATCLVSRRNWRRAC